MTKEQILIKAIEKAKKNGFLWGTPLTEDAISEYIGLCTYYWTIFSHEFAKAFWGEGLMMNMNTEITKRKPPLWQYHLQQMVICEEPLDYLKKFLENA